MIVPSTPGGTRSDVSRTSPAFSPKIARRSFSSGESCVSPFGVMPTRISPGRTSAPMRMIPLSVESSSASSPTFGMSRVISSGPSLVSRATHSNSSMWTEVNRSPRPALADQDRVFKVVAAPRHERNQHVAAQRQFAHIGGCTVGDHISRTHPVAGDDDRPLVDTGTLIRALVLGEGVDVDPRVAVRVTGVGFDHDAGGVDTLDNTGPSRHQRHARVPRHNPLHTGADERCLGPQQWHRLALHVRPHQRAVGVVVSEERGSAPPRHSLVWSARRP